MPNFPSSLSNLASPRRRALAIALLLGAGAPALPAAAAPVVFAAAGEFLLVVDGKEQPRAEIYRAPATAQILVISSALPSPVVLSPGAADGAAKVETVQLMKVAKQLDGGVHLLDGATLAAQGDFRLDGDTVLFSADGHQNQLKPKPPLLKTQTSATLIAHNPAYGRRAETYRPAGATLQALRGSRKQPVKVQVFFGSWCPHCTEYVPRLLKVQEALGTATPIQIEYYGLPPFPALNDDPEAKRLGIKGVPIGVVWVGGKEAGRITGSGWTNPEVTLKDILDAWSSI